MHTDMAVTGQTNASEHQCRTTLILANRS